MTDSMTSAVTDRGTDRTYRAVNLLGRTLMRALGLTVRASGTEHLPKSGPVILAMTHVSYPDFVFVEKAAVERGRYVRFMCRHDIWVRARRVGNGPDAAHPGQPGDTGVLLSGRPPAAPRG